MKSASMVVTFGHIIIYIHAQHAKEDLTLRKLSSDSKLKGLQMLGKKEEACRGTSEQETRAENNKERFHWRGKSSRSLWREIFKAQSKLEKEAWKETCRRGVGFRRPCYSRRKRERESSNIISKFIFRAGKLTELTGCKVPFYEALTRG